MLTNGFFFRILSLPIAFVFAFLHAYPVFADQRVTIGFDHDYPPFAYVDEVGNPKGIYTEILLKVFGKLEGYDVQLEGYPWKRLMKLVERGKLLGAYPPYYWPEKRPWMAPYSEPILIERVVLYCNSRRVNPLNLARPVSWPESFKGFVIGNDQGYHTPGGQFFDAVEAGRIKLHEDTSERNAMLLLSGRIDCYVNGEMSILHAMDKHISAGRFKADDMHPIYRALTIRENAGYIGYAKQDDDFPYKTDFVSQVDQIIRELRQSGEIDQIIEQLRLPQNMPLSIDDHIKKVQP